MRLIKDFESPENKPVIKEAFKAGSSAGVAEKMYRILSKRVGKNFMFSGYPTEFVNREGKFMGYYATLGSNMLVRINFLLGKSDNVHSIDIFTKNPNKPDKTINLMGFNIVQIIDQIADVFTGDYGKYDESVNGRNDILNEASLKLSDVMIKWIEEEGNDSLPMDISAGRVNVENEFTRFSRYCKDTHGKKPPKHSAAFLWLVSAYSQRNNLRGVEIPSIQVNPGSQEDPINTDTEAEAAYRELLENEHLLKYRILEFYVKQVAEGNKLFRGLYVYGDGGVGKSYLAKKYLEPISKTYYMSGKIKGYTGLANFLFNHRKNEIIVLDDVMTDGDMNNASVAQILKGALDPEPPRRIQVKSAAAAAEGAEFKNGILTINLSEKDYKDYKKNALKEYETIDMTSPEGFEGDDDEKNDFIFDSSIVFLTNYPKIPQALNDRCWSLEMIFSNQQIMDIIEINIAKIRPDNLPEASELFNLITSDEVDPVSTRAVVEFMRNQDASGVVKRKFSIRVFKRLLSLYSATKHTPMWKSFLMMEMGRK